jgi:hypothetical protein
MKSAALIRRALLLVASTASVAAAAAAGHAPLPALRSQHGRSLVARSVSPTIPVTRPPDIAEAGCGSGPFTPFEVLVERGDEQATAAALRKRRVLRQLLPGRLR